VPSKTLIALFSIDYSLHSFQSEKFQVLDEESWKLNQAEIGKSWAKENWDLNLAEIALFQSSLSAIIDYYPADYRRFILVGNSWEEQLRNAFELGFEKGFEKILFVEASLENCSTSKLKWILGDWEGEDLFLNPKVDGSVGMWGFKEDAFWHWDEFRFYEPAIMVELIGEAMEKGISYRIFKD
jgi:hypothetical protein